MLASSRRALQLTPALTPLGLLSSPARSARDASWNTAPCTPSSALPFIRGEGPLGLPNYHPPPRPIPATPWIARLPLATGISPTQSSPALPRRHALRADALPHLWEACHAGRYACGHPSPPPFSTPSHSRWVEAPTSQELGEGALWLAPALGSLFQVALGPCTLYFFQSHSEFWASKTAQIAVAHVGLAKYFSTHPCPHHPPRPILVFFCS